MRQQSRVLRIAVPLIFVLFCVTAYQYGYESVSEQMAGLKDMQRTKIKTLQKYMNIIAEKPGLEAKLAALKEKRAADQSKIIDATTPSLAANTLVDTVKTIVTGKGGSITSERAEKPDDLGKFKIVNVAMDVVLPDARALSDVVYGIETRTPSIVIKELDSRVRNFRDPRELMVKLRVAALTGGK
jgi:hypothetical protein